MTATTLAAAIRQAQRALHSSDSPRLDAELLLAHCLQVDRGYLYTWPERTLDDASLEHFQSLVQRRLAGEPIAYLIGRQEFWTLSLEVNAATLIPRPETELLIEAALEQLPAHAQANVLDLGTGSGAIALAIALERPQASVTALDISAQALAVAQRNRERAAATNVEFMHSDWFAAVQGRRFDLIAANPPYIGAHEPEPSQGDCRFEPRNALIAAEGGLAALRRIIDEAPAYLAGAGWLMLEHGYAQGAAVRELMQAAAFERVRTLKDLQQHERVSVGQLSVFT